MDFKFLEKNNMKHLVPTEDGNKASFVLVYSEDDIRRICKEHVNRKFGSGGGNSGRAIIGFINNKDDATTITPVDQPNLSEQYQFLTREYL